MRRTRGLRALLAAAACVLLAGCVRMPTEGPVVEPRVPAESEQAPGISFDPRPPRPDETPSEIVAGFLEAMKATPISLTVARQFLSRSADKTWAPEKQIVTYAELGTPTGVSAVRLPMSDVNLYDDRGAWQRTRATRDLDLTLVQEDGEWRIDQVPDALVVPDSWFEDFYQRVSLYYFDPTSEVLVPEPVFVPRGDQFASSLVRGLLAQPTGESVDVARTWFPAGTTTRPVVITRAGIAEVSLSGDPDAIDTDTAQRMLTQLAWTLRQDLSIRAVQLTVGDRLITFGSSSTQVGLDVGSRYDPSGPGSSRQLFALDRGRVVAGDVGSFEETLGPLGQGAYRLRSLGVTLTGARVAGISRDGTQLLTAPTDTPDGVVTAPVTDGVDLAAPAFDYRDRTWLLDRAGGRARILLVVDGDARAVDVPGLTGRDVTKLLVSRDGTRLVAVVRGASADRIVAARVLHDASGAVLGFTSLRTLPLPAEGSTRVRDVAWRSPTTVSVLSDINADFSQVRTISVDGAPGRVDTGGATSLRGRFRALVSAPLEDPEAYAVGGRSISDLTRQERTVPDLPAGLTSLTYVG
ncbi:LpqB family beta-propeller domain-containing protein [Nocardioides zeicaulis]|uniref:LpqB family beta-propeller domain-containing protein n=1 Tax=Nocardioides zeicaulis TaxID=1776857 RepID=A0ABV6E5V9_9ACTN